MCVLWSSGVCGKRQGWRRPCCACVVVGGGWICVVVGGGWALSRGVVAFMLLRAGVRPALPGVPTHGSSPWPSPPVLWAWAWAHKPRPPKTMLTAAMGCVSSPTPMQPAGMPTTPRVQSRATPQQPHPTNTRPQACTLLQWSCVHRPSFVASTAHPPTHTHPTTHKHRSFFSHGGKSRRLWVQQPQPQRPQTVPAPRPCIIIVITAEPTPPPPPPPRARTPSPHSHGGRVRAAHRHASLLGGGKEQQCLGGPVAGFPTGYREQ